MVTHIAYILAWGLPLTISAAQELCHEDGQCSGGTIVAIPQADSYNLCLDACTSTPNCEWLTYYQGTGRRCVLLDSCPKVDTTCDICLVGQVRCGPEQPRAPINGMLLVIGGSGPASSKVELVDLMTTKDRICPSMPDYPGANYGSIGTYIDRRARVCGGDPVTNTCYFMKQGTHSWVKTTPMGRQRYLAAGVQLSPTEWWITGGTNGPYLDSTEVYNVDEDSFSPFVDLPEDKDNHNLVPVNDTHFMLLGGDDVTSKVWMFDRSVQEWIPLPDLLEERAFIYAGLVKYPDGRQAVVVAGGSKSKTSEILDLDLEGLMTWRYGPDLPVLSNLYGGASVQFQSSFLLIGGYDGFFAVNTIYTFDTVTEDWVELRQKLNITRFRSATAFLVPDDFAECV